MNLWEYLNRRAARKYGLAGTKSRSSFWARLMSAQTARFILTLLALALSAATTFYVTSGLVVVDLKDVAVFALGQMFTLTAIGYNYYFGSTARRDERPMDAHITNPPTDPVPTAPQSPETPE